MSDTLQLVVNVPNTQHYKNKATFQALNEYPIRFSLSSTFPTLNTTRTTQHSKRSTNVRYASACRRPQYHSTQQEWLNECSICFSLSSTLPTLNTTRTTQHSKRSVSLTLGF